MRFTYLFFTYLQTTGLTANCGPPVINNLRKPSVQPHHISGLDRKYKRNMAPTSLWLRFILMEDERWMSSELSQVCKGKTQGEVSGKGRKRWMLRKKMNVDINLHNYTYNSLFSVSFNANKNECIQICILHTYSEMPFITLPSTAFCSKRSFKTKQKNPSKQKNVILAARCRVWRRDQSRTKEVHDQLPSRSSAEHHCNRAVKIKQVKHPSCIII